MADQVKNFAYSTTTAAVTAGATTFSIQSGHGARFPATASGAYNLVVWNPKYKNASTAYQNSAAEIIRVTTRATDTFSVITRAQEGTSAIAWEADWVVELNATAKNFTDLELPSQTGNSGEYLTTNGTTASWGNPASVVTLYTASISSGATVYTNSGLASNGSTESDVTSVFVSNTAVKNLRVRVVGNAGASLTVTVRKNSQDTALAATAAGGGTGADSTDTITYEGAGGTDDSFSIKIVATSSGFAVVAWITYEVYTTA